MSTKSITITNDAYERLAALKGRNESFSEVITKITMKHSLLDLIGLLSKEEANELRKNINDTRERLRQNINKIGDRLN